MLDYVEDPDDPNAPEHEECLIVSPDGRHKVLFINVPEGNFAEPRTAAAVSMVDRLGQIG